MSSQQLFDAFVVCALQLIQISLPGWMVGVQLQYCLDLLLKKLAGIIMPHFVSAVGSGELWWGLAHDAGAVAGCYGCVRNDVVEGCK